MNPTGFLFQYLGRRTPARLAGTALVLLTVLVAPVAHAQGPAMRRKEPEAPVPKGPTGAAEQQFPYGATWVLDTIDGKPVSGDVPSFRLDDKLRATGFGGCNSFSMAFYPIKGQKLAAGSIATTKKSCGKPLDDMEHTILVGLHSLPVWRLESNGNLTVKAQTATMVFHRGL